MVFLQSHSRPGGVEKTRMCTLAKAALRKKSASPLGGVANSVVVNTSYAGTPLTSARPDASPERRCAFCKTPSVGMQLLEPCAFLPRNGDDYFSRKSPMRIWCNDSQYIFARAMIFLMKICHFHTKCQFYSKKTKVFKISTISRGVLFEAHF